jgi:hypothetical protein
VGGLVFKPVQLLENEFISRSDTAYHWRGRWTSSLGKLYLTNLRLIYSGMPGITVGLMGLPWSRESLTLDLDDIQFVGRIDVVWAEYLRRGISADAYFVDANGQRHCFGPAIGEHLSWLQDLKRPLSSKETGGGD